jgi:hypothetical protein
MMERRNEKTQKGGNYAKPRNTQTKSNTTAVSPLFSFFFFFLGRGEMKKKRKNKKEETPNPPEVIPGGEGVWGEGRALMNGKNGASHSLGLGFLRGEKIF